MTMPPPIYRTDGIVSVRPGKTELDRQMEKWAMEPKHDPCRACELRRAYPGWPKPNPDLEKEDSDERS